MSTPNKEDILDALYEEEYEFYQNDGYRGEQCCILAREGALYRYENGHYQQGDYECD